MIALCTFESSREFRGTDVYARNLIYGLSRLEPTEDYIVFTNRAATYDYLLKTPNFTVYPVNIPAEAIHTVNFAGEGRLSPDLLWLHTDLHRLIKEYSINLVHPLGYYGPQCRMPFEKVKIVMTAHGMEHEIAPHMFRPEMVRFLQKSVPKSFEIADHVIVDSHFVEEDMHTLYHIPHEKMTMIHHGVSQAFMREPSGHRLVPPYILYVGSGEERKNFITVLRGFQIFKARNPHSPLKLVSVMDRPDAYLSYVKIWNLMDSVEFRGFLPQDELVRVYQDAFIFSCLSVYEGFGLIVAEAMACCVPMIVSDIPPFKEILSGAGFHINPLDGNEFARYVEILMEDEALYQRTKERLRSRRAEFSIENMATKTREVYRQTMAGAN